MSESERRRTALASHAAVDRGHLDLFISYLQELPLGTWVNATRRHKPDDHEASAEAALTAALHEVRDPDAVFAAREAVLSALERFDTAEGRSLTRGRPSTRNLRPETERAALAVLVRPQLTPDHFRRLYSAFEPLIPATLLFGIDRGT